MHSSIIMDLLHLYHILDTHFIYFLCNNQYVLMKLHYTVLLCKSYFVRSNYSRNLKDKIYYVYNSLMSLL